MASVPIKLFHFHFLHSCVPHKRMLWLFKWQVSLVKVFHIHFLFSRIHHKKMLSFFKWQASLVKVFHFHFLHSSVPNQTFFHFKPKKMHLLFPKLQHQSSWWTGTIHFLAQRFQLDWTGAKEYLEFVTFRKIRRSLVLLEDKECLLLESISFSRHFLKGGGVISPSQKFYDVPKTLNTKCQHWKQEECSMSIAHITWFHS